MMSEIVFLAVKLIKQLKFDIMLAKKNQKQHEYTKEW